MDHTQYMKEFKIKQKYVELRTGSVIKNTNRQNAPNVRSKAIPDVHLDAQRDLIGGRGECAEITEEGSPHGVALEFWHGFGPK